MNLEKILPKNGPSIDEVEKYIKKYLRGEIAEVGPGNGGNLSGYLNFPKKIFLGQGNKLQNTLRIVNKVQLYHFYIELKSKKVGFLSQQ